MARTVLAESFRWHDALDSNEFYSGRYHYGEQGYLVMDGSRGRIKCNRRIEPTITQRSASVELGLRVVLGHPYAICLYDSRDQLVIRCVLGTSGWIRFSNHPHLIESGKFLSSWYGLPSIDPNFSSPSHTRESDEHIFRFEEFDFTNGTFKFSLDGDATTIAGAFNTPAGDIAKIELQTLLMEQGARIRLRNYVHRDRGKIIAADEFPWHWMPVPPQPDGYPYDHISETTLRPAEYQWLQTTTHYGWVKVRFPKIARGEVHFRVMTPDVQREAVVLLEEDDGTIAQGCRAHAGILEGKFCCCSVGTRFSKVLQREVPMDDVHYLDDIVPEPDRAYSFKVAWEANGYRIWIDGQPMKVRGEDLFAFEMAQRPFRGIDTLTLHPGYPGTRLTLAYKHLGYKPPTELPEPHIAYWGDFRVLDFTQDEDS